MAAKLIRQPDQLVLAGAPTSAAAASAGVERGPAAFRERGILERLRATGYLVSEAGDPPSQVFQPDPENPRARNVKAVLAALEALRMRVEQAARVHAFPLILGGDASILLAMVAGLRRQAASLGLVHIGRYADLHTPTDTEDGLIGPMTVSHLVGQGAAELVRFWKNPPLVREPDLVAFGLGETDAIDRERLNVLAIRRFSAERIRSLGVRAAAGSALEHLRGNERDFVVHLSCDVFPAEEVPGCARGGPGGLSVSEVGEAMNLFAAHETFAGLSVSGYNPDLDPERRGAAAMVDLIIGAMTARRSALHSRPAKNDGAEEKKLASTEASGNKTGPAAGTEGTLPATAGDPDPGGGT